MSKTQFLHLNLQQIIVKILTNCYQREFHLSKKTVHLVVKKCKAVNKRKKREANKDLMVNKITLQKKRKKVSLKTATRKALMKRSKPWKNKDMESCCEI